MSSGYFRYPTIYSDNVVFVSEDDLWTVPSGGGIARRLTSNLGEVTRPSLSPDGRLLAFVGREEGADEVYVMPALGGPARRLTYMGGSLCLIAGWTPDGKILFANNAEHWYLRFSYLYSIDPAGGIPQRMNVGMARSISFGPGGAVVLGRHTDDPARWKRYRGGTAGRLWIDENGDGNFRPLIQLPGNLASPMWLAGSDSPSSGRIYFISDHEGHGNLYSCLPSGEDLRRHTDHDDYYARNASTDGHRIVYHAGADLYLFDPASETNALIPVEYHSPRVQRNRKFVDAASYLEYWTLHPGGQAIAISARGKAFTFANWEGAVFQHGDDGTTNLDNTPQASPRYRLPTWLNDGKRLIAVTDRGGEESFVIWKPNGGSEPEYLSDLDIGRPEAIAVNPVKDQILFSNHRYELMLLDLGTRTLQRIDRGKAFRIAGFAWSPDGRWAAYSVSISLEASMLKLWNAESGDVIPLTRPVLRDVEPAFDPQGRYLYFLSYRTFNPVYDNLHFELSFPRGMKPYLITLQKDLPSPFVPQPRIDQEEEEEKEGEDQAPEGLAESTGSQVDGSDGQGAEIPAEAAPVVEAGEPVTGDAKEEPQPETPVLQIDLEDIEQRIVAFPVEEGIYGRILGTRDGKVVYSRFPTEGAINSSGSGFDAKGTLLTYNFEEQKEETLVSGISDFTISANGRMLLYRAGRRLRVIKAGEKPADDRNGPNRKSGWIDLNRVKVAVLPPAEWRQMFREAWRLQRDQFWTADMSQIDWVNVHNRYLPLVERVSSRSEFSDLMWEMQGELGTSHAYEMGGDYRPEPSYTQGYLGADFEWAPEADGWRVTRIYQGDPWDSRASSPLLRPSANVKVGDVLQAINGKRLSARLSPGEALVNLAGQEVTLSVFSAGDARPRLAAVKTLYNEMMPRYREWVEANRERVHQATNGRIGYIHIPDMVGWGYAEFHRGYLAEVERQGLIVDVRFNRGGHVSALLLEKLARKRLGYDNSRWGEILIPYPPESVLGPLVAITNEFAGSDGDIFSHGFKMLKLGPLIGKRTWGGVIGIEPRHALVDGTITTQPEYSFWFSDVGWGVENYGTDPDIEVDITPQDFAAGRDPQLERAIEEIQQMLEAVPPGPPELPDRPIRAAPRLPKR